jgi:hypothetical protein
MATWQVELQQYHYKLHHKPGENMHTDALSRCSDFNTGNPMNDHLIVLPLDCFKGMPEAIQLLLNVKLDSQSYEIGNPTSKITLGAGGLENKEPSANDLDSMVK